MERSSSPGNSFEEAAQSAGGTPDAAPVVGDADAFGQAATHAPQPMHAAASIARSASAFPTGIALPSGAPPV